MVPMTRDEVIQAVAKARNFSAEEIPTRVAPAVERWFASADARDRGVRMARTFAECHAATLRNGDADCDGRYPWDAESAAQWRAMERAERRLACVIAAIDSEGP